jgi:pseudaminic acid biosynthesis-associated methylase
MNDISGSQALAQWCGEPGNAYIKRNRPLIEARIALWSGILVQSFGGGRYPDSFLEVGAGSGQNLEAIKALRPEAKTIAIEPNLSARSAMIESGIVDDIRSGWATGIPCADDCAEMAFTSGVLIHIPPDRLLDACREIYRCSSRYIGCIEYFSADPEEKPYRGPAGRLWKRDFGSFWLDNFPGLKPLACGFAWKRMTGLDNLTWAVFEKTQ